MTTAGPAQIRLEEFYELQNNQPMNEEQIEFAKKMIEICKGDNQEGK